MASANDCAVIHKPQTVHIKTWSQFKQVATTLEPSSISHSIQRRLLSKPPVNCRLIFTIQNTQYVFPVLAKVKALRHTEIPIQTTSTEETLISKEAISNFLREQLKRKDLNIYASEVLG